MSEKALYKKVDRSMMDWGLTLPKEYIDDFESGEKIELGTSRNIEIIWDNKKYPAKLCNVNRKGFPPVHQIRWDGSRELLKKLRKTFIQSYVILKSQKEFFDVSKDKNSQKHFRTNLLGGQQEVLILKPINPNKIKFEIFIKIENEWNFLFERLAEENVFGWAFDKNKKYLIQRSTNWIEVKDFKKYVNATNVIYYLANTKKKLLYVGKAEILGNRVKPGKQHQGMSGDWDIFRFDIVRSEYSNILERIEDHTIRALASLLKNTKNYPSLELSSYRLVNSNWKKL